MPKPLLALTGASPLGVLQGPTGLHIVHDGPEKFYAQLTAIIGTAYAFREVFPTTSAGAVVWNILTGGRSGTTTQNSAYELTGSTSGSVSGGSPAGGGQIVEMWAAPSGSDNVIGQVYQFSLGGAGAGALTTATSVETIASIKGTAGAWVSFPTTLQLPGAGTYRVDLYMGLLISANQATGNVIRFRIFDLTNNADLFANFAPGGSPYPGWQFTNGVLASPLSVSAYRPGYTVTAPATLALQYMYVLGGGFGQGANVNGWFTYLKTG